MYKTNSHKKIYKNNWMTIWEDDVTFPDGSKGIYGYMERKSGGPFIIPMTKNNELILLKEWRYPRKNWTWCFPGGDVDKGEAELDAAKRELKEETGIIAKKWLPLGKFQIDPGYNTQIDPIFLAEDLVFTSKTDKESSEIFEVHKIKIDKVKDMVNTGEINNGWTLSCLCKLFLHLEK